MMPNFMKNIQQERALHCLWIGRYVFSKASEFLYSATELPLDTLGNLAQCFTDSCYVCFGLVMDKAGPKDVSGHHHAHILDGEKGQSGKKKTRSVLRAQTFGVSWSS
jgi:hypothetical protein